MSNRKKRLAKELALQEKEQKIKASFQKRKSNTRIGLRSTLDGVVEKQTNKQAVIANASAKNLFKLTRRVHNRYLKNHRLLLQILQHSKITFSYLFYYERLAEALIQIKVCRDLSGWKMPKTKDDAIILKRLLFHLLVPYKMPRAVEMFCYQFITNGLACEYKIILFDLLQGKGAHKVDGLPLRLNGRGNYFFHQAPEKYQWLRAVWWAKLRSKQLPYSMASQLVDNLEIHLGTTWEPWHEELVHFSNRHQDLPRKDLKTILSFITDQKQGSVLIDLPGINDYSYVPPLYPEFSFKGRTVASVFRYVEKWRTYVKVLQDNAKIGKFKLSIFKPFRKSCKKNKIVIRQIKSVASLAKEGARMNHCVASYADDCIAKNVSIWSMQELLVSGKTKHLLTIEVNEEEKEISERRGYSNRVPYPHEKIWLEEWAEQEGLVLS